MPNFGTLFAQIWAKTNFLQNLGSISLWKKSGKMIPRLLTEMLTWPTERETDRWFHITLHLVFWIDCSLIILKWFGNAHPCQRKLNWIVTHMQEINLKLASAIFYQIFIFSTNDSLSKTVKNVLKFHLKSSFRSRDIKIFCNFPLPLHTSQIQMNKWKWNNLWCHKLACINLRV